MQQSTGFTWTKADGTDKRELPITLPPHFSFQWLDNSQNIVYGRRDSLLYGAELLNLDSGVHWKLSDDRSGISEVFLSPDGQRLAFATLDQTNLWTLHLASPDGQWSRILPTGWSGFDDGQVAWSPDSSQLAHVDSGASLNVDVISVDGIQRRHFSHQINLPPLRLPILTWTQCN